MLEKPLGKTKIAASYRAKQPIENFKLRVKIVQRKSLLAELFENEAKTRDSNFLETEERVFNWQEKVFGPFETKYYRDEKNCVTEKQKEYHRRIVDESIEGSRLFSYTQDDSYYSDNGLLTRDYKSCLSERNASALPIVRNRKPFTERYNKKVVETRPNKTRICSNHYLYREREIMYVLVDLTPKDEMPSDSSDSETLLCTVTFDRVHKTLTISPDFTYDECYSVDGTGMSYDYWIEHASAKESPRELQYRTDILRDEMHQRQIYKDAELFHEVQLPPLNILRVFLNLDITLAYDFPYDAVFVTYFYDLPSHWSTSRPEHLSGRTQRCRMKNGSANFSYVAEITLDLDLNCLNDKKILPSWPQLLISVASLDSWTRYCIEGYASLPLPATPGSHNFTVRTWRPVGSFVNSLRRFFTGGTCELEDITYCGIPATHEGRRLEKLNLEVAPSGCVELKINIAHQSQSFTRNQDFQRDTFERLSAGTLMKSVNNVLEQFTAARERMIRARAVKS